MKRIYGVFLRLYPREFRDLFGPEVLNVFAQAAEAHRARGWIAWAWFLLSELSGALASAGRHWIDRFHRGVMPLTPKSRARGGGDYSAPWMKRRIGSIRI